MLYDDLDRLTMAIADNLWGEASYLYDGLDNIVSATQGGRQYRYEYNYTGDHRLARMRSPSGANPIDFAYNAVGDVRQKNSANYSYDNAHRLRAVQGIATYVYDGNGLRVKETKTSGATFEYGLYNQAGLKLYEKAGSNGTRNIYLAGSVIATTVDGDELNSTYMLTDALGSVVADSSPVGGILSRYRYAPYGESLGAPLGTPMDGLGYTGHDMDADTGLTYMQQRYYDPIVGRFLAIDPNNMDANNGANFNRYVYVSANPFRFFDPDGREQVNLFNPIATDRDERLHFEISSRYADVKGVFFVQSHGNMGMIFDWRSGAQIKLSTPEKIAEVLKTYGWKEGDPVVFYGCRTGQGEANIAKRFAETYGGDISAPDTYTWDNGDGAGANGPTRLFDKDADGEQDRSKPGRMVRYDGGRLKHEVEEEERMQEEEEARRQKREDRRSRH